MYWYQHYLTAVVPLYLLMRHDFQVHPPRVPTHTHPNTHPFTNPFLTYIVALPHTYIYIYIYILYIYTYIYTHAGPGPANGELLDRLECLLGVRRAGPLWILFILRLYFQGEAQFLHPHSHPLLSYDPYSVRGGGRQSRLVRRSPVLHPILIPILIPILTPCLYWLCVCACICVQR